MPSLKPDAYADEIVAGARTSAPRQALDEPPIPRAVLEYLPRQEEHLHHFTLAPSFARTISRREVIDTWADLAAAGLLHLPYDCCSISFRRNDLLLNPCWGKGVAKSPAMGFDALPMPSIRNSVTALPSAAKRRETWAAPKNRKRKTQNRSRARKQKTENCKTKTKIIVSFSCF